MAEVKKQPVEYEFLPSAALGCRKVARVFVITGPSGVGKGTLIRGLMERLPGLELSVSATTRAPRAGEQDGVAAAPVVARRKDGTVVAVRYTSFGTGTKRAGTPDGYSPPRGT